MKIGSSAARIATSRAKYEALRREIVAHDDWVQSVLILADDITEDAGEAVGGFSAVTELAEDIDTRWSNCLLHLDAFRERVKDNS